LDRFVLYYISLRSNTGLSLEDEMEGRTSAHLCIKANKDIPPVSVEASQSDF
jgi:hypothetical protein